MTNFREIVEAWVWANKIYLSAGHPKGIHPKAQDDLVSRLELATKGWAMGCFPEEASVVSVGNSIPSGAVTMADDGASTGIAAPNTKPRRKRAAK